MVVYMLNLSTTVPFRVSLSVISRAKKNLVVLEKGKPLDGWTTYGQASIALNNAQPLSNALPAQMKVTINAGSTTPSGVNNGGFFGIKVQPQTYMASFYYRPSTGASVAGGKLNVGFTAAGASTVFGTSPVDVSNARVGVWANYTATITVSTAAPTTKNNFFVEFPAGSQGDFEFNLISCFPPTFKNRANGARVDIAQAFADLQPGYVRFPGGNDLEGPSIAERFIWNQTIGLLQNRPGRRGSWVGYNTEGFGLLELATFVEDIGATPLLAIYAGYSLNRETVPENQLQPYIDDVINEIDFLTASADTNPMGALRRSLGRAKPFDIKYVEIGNEDFFAPDSYRYRWPAFYNVLSKKYPNITFIATVIPSGQTVPAVDDHNYETPEYFINNFRRYEHIPRPTPKVLVGEFSVINDHASNSLDFPSIRAAVAESIYRIGFERNSDVIIGGCYAPVLQNVDATQWTPNLILFNANITVRSVSHLAQQMFGNLLGNVVLNSTAANSDMMHASVRRGEEGDGKLGNLYFIATKNTTANKLILKLVSVDASDTVVNVQLQGSTTSSEGIVHTLSAGAGVDPGSVKNTIENPNAASVVAKSLSSTDGRFTVTVPSWGVVVVTLPL